MTHRVSPSALVVESNQVAHAGLWQVLDEKGGLVADCSLSSAERIEFLQWMLLLRVLDERLSHLVRQGRIGFYGACTGQEAVPVASGFAVEAGDWVFPALRESGIMLVRGFPLTSYLAQLVGNSWDVLRGRQMPCHMSGRSVNQVSWSSCVGTQLPQAVGAARAIRVFGERKVVLGFLGDGATSTGDSHAALEFARLWRAPCVFVCQNNQYSISCPVGRQTSVATLALKASAHGIPSLRVDGNDVLAVHDAVTSGVTRARSGEGPSFIECVTYRVGPHSSSDEPRRYRSEQEEFIWQKRDPLVRLKRHLVQSEILNESGVQHLRNAAEASVDRALALVEAAPRLERSSLFDDVYAALPWHLVEQRAELLALPAVSGLNKFSP